MFLSNRSSQYSTKNITFFYDHNKLLPEQSADNKTKIRHIFNFRTLRAFLVQTRNVLVILNLQIAQKGNSCLYLAFFPKKKRFCSIFIIGRCCDFNKQISDYFVD